MALFSPPVDISLISIFLVTASQIMQRTVVDKREMKRQQDQMKENQKKMKELMSKQDQKSKNQLEALEKEMLDSMNSVMKGSMRLMLYSLVVFIPAFFFMGGFDFGVISFGGVYSQATIELPVPLPWFGSESIIQFYNETNWLGGDFVSYLVLTLIIGQLFKHFYDTRVMSNAN